MELLPMSIGLNSIEEDFIEFVSQKRKRPPQVIKELYLQTKHNHHNFDTLGYGKLMGVVQELYRVMYDPSDENYGIESYQIHGLLHLFRYLSYSFPKASSSYFRETLYHLKKGRLKEICIYATRKIVRVLKKRPSSGSLIHISTAELLLKHVSQTPVVVDYGAGLGYISFEIASLCEDSKVYLVDIPSLVSEFAEFRFKKYNVDVELIPITTENLYPELPPHTICIATDVMEHLQEPTVAYRNIYNSLEKEGILFGDFEDREPHSYHISANLSELRKRIAQDFQPLGNRAYKKL